MSLELDLADIPAEDLEWALSLPLRPYGRISHRDIGDMVAPIAPVALPTFLRGLTGWSMRSTSHEGAAEIWAQEIVVLGSGVQSILVPLNDTFADFELRLISAIDGVCEATDISFAKLMLKLRQITRSKRQEALEQRMGTRGTPKP